MTIQVLISTMNQQDIVKLVSRMKVASAVVINQVTQNITHPEDSSTKKLTLITMDERGLSKSRNAAFKAASSDICVIADDDMYYAKDYEAKIVNAYTKYPDADIIAFYVDHENTALSPKKQREGKLSLMETMKVSSCRITFKRSSIIKNKLEMDIRFGANTENYMGEENIFLFDAMKKKLNVYSVPEKIATLKEDNQSTWFTGYDERYFNVKGRVFYRMSKILAPILITQFAIRKKHLYKGSMSLFAVWKYMLIGMLQEAKYEA